MTKDDLKHAAISLVLGVVTMAVMQLVTGALHILQTWIADAAGGTVSAMSYLQQRNWFS